MMPRGQSRSTRNRMPSPVSAGSYMRLMRIMAGSPTGRRSLPPGRWRPSRCGGSRTEVDRPPAGRQGRSHFLVGKSSLGPDRGESPPPAPRSPLSILRSPLSRDGQQPVRFAGRLQDQFGPVLGRVDEHQAVPAALFRGLDDRPPQPAERLVARWATARRVRSGRRRATPNSTAFSTSHFWRSPFGRATTSVKSNGSSRWTSCRPASDSSTSVRPARLTRAANSAPLPSKTVMRTPGVARITWIKWCASSPRRMMRSPEIGSSAKYRSAISAIGYHCRARRSVPSGLRGMAGSSLRSQNDTFKSIA